MDMLTVELPHAIPRRMSYRGTERVALLIGSFEDDTYTVRTLVEIGNEHGDPEDHFMVSTERARVMIGAEIDHVIGALHTHPRHQPAPSDSDLRNIPEGWIGGVVINRHVTAWYRHGEEVDAALRFNAPPALLYAG